MADSDRLWAHGFRHSFTPLLAVLFTFPSRYWFAIGLPGVFSLAGWSPRFRTGFLVPRPTQGAAGASSGCAYGALTPFGPAFQPVPLPLVAPYGGPTTPAAPERPRFGLLPFRSPLLGESLLFSPPPPT